MKNYYRRCDGVTLTEVLVAIAILGLVIAGFLSASNMLRRTRKISENHYKAVIIANNRIERAKQVDMQDLDLLEEFQTSVNDLGAPDPDGRFLRTTVITPHYDNDPLLTHVAVTVHTPLLPGARSRGSEELSTILTEYLEP